MRVIAETVSEIDPASERYQARYQAGIRDDIRKARRSIVVTEFTSSIPTPTKPLVASVSPGSQRKSNISSRSFVMA